MQFELDPKTREFCGRLNGEKPREITSIYSSLSTLMVGEPRLITTEDGVNCYVGTLASDGNLSRVRSLIEGSRDRFDPEDRSTGEPFSYDHVSPIIP